MSRIARDKSTTGVYHSILRGINKQQIFECTEDYEHFVRILQRQCGLPVETRPTKIRKMVHNQFLSIEEDEVEKPERHCYLYAWCLMGNHVHLLIRGCGEEIGDVMKRITSSYVFYYNHKYNRVGHLFQERFKSQPVEDWDYFLLLLRYIHQNPTKAKIVQRVQDYRWSSWSEYMLKHPLPFSSIQAVLNRISYPELEEQVNTPLHQEQEEEFIDITTSNGYKYLTDEEAWDLIKQISGVSNLSDFQSLDRPIQKHYLYEAHSFGVGIRTLSRLTGISYTIVRNAATADIERKRQRHYLEVINSDEQVNYVEDDSILDKYPDY